MRAKMDEDVRRMVKTTDATKKKLPLERLKSVFVEDRPRRSGDGGRGGASENSGKRKGRPLLGGRFERNNGEWDGIRKANVAHGDAWKNEDQVDEQMRFHPANHARLVALRGKRRSWREPSSLWARFKGPEATRLVGEDPSQEKGRQISILFNCEKRNIVIQTETNYRRLAHR